MVVAVAAVVKVVVTWVDVKAVAEAVTMVVTLTVRGCRERGGKLFLRDGRTLRLALVMVEVAVDVIMEEGNAGAVAMAK